jgi:PAS domain S-box-containing protein
MFKNLKISVGFKITNLVIFVVVFSVFIVSLVAYYITTHTVQRRYKETVEVIAKLKSEKIQAFFEKIKANIKFGTELNLIKDKVLEYSNISLQNTALFDSIKHKIDTAQISPIDSLQLTSRDSSDILQQNIKKILGKSENVGDLFQKILTTYDIQNIFLTDADGKVLLAEGIGIQGESAKSFQNKNFANNNQDGSNVIHVGRDSIYFSNPYLDKYTDEHFNNEQKYIQHLYVSAPIKDLLNNTIGVLIYDVNLKEIYDLVSDSTGLGKTGTIVLTKDQGLRVLKLNPDRNQDFQSFENSNKMIVSGQEKGKPYWASAKGYEDLAFVKDTKNKSILAYWNQIPTINWGITIQIDEDEVFEPIQSLFWFLFITGVIILLISSIIAFVFSRRITKPILVLKEVIHLLSQGILPESIQRNSNDEIGEMAQNLNHLVARLKYTANFARSIGQGNFNAELQLMSEKDSLGTALLTMRDSIQTSAERDDERNWIVTGLAEIGDILPSISTIEKLGELVTEYVTKKINAIQGAFYTINDDEENLLIEMNASYAYNKKKHLKASFKFAEGLVGQAASEQDTIVRTEIPNDYMTISSGILGDKKPKCLLIRPLITNETVYGVLEFAGFEKFEHREIEFVEEISELIARTVFNIKVKENTERLLEESQKMGLDLQLQQEILQQSNELMEATSEKLRETNDQLEDKVKEVQKANQRTRLLLENASEVITVYEPDMTIRSISPSVQKILGYTEEEMIGTRDIVYVHPNYIEAYEQMFKQLVDTPDEKITIEFSYLTKSQEKIWLEASGTNLLNDPAIQGLVLNIRDITERKRAEKEQRLRGQMQALSENSPDLITRISKEGVVFYINPTIEIYTGKNKDNYLQKHLHELDLGESILSSWANIVKDVTNKNQKVNLDMDFPSIMGDRVMHVDAIPEFSEQKTIESVLVVSHDITERKLIELEISQKNRKITESINYAKRIQEAILPDTEYVRQFLPASFILYKPRDVVSGDFPWFLQKGDDIYIAAVDCTGHGVPGALISLIGFFLLNNIINVHRTGSPSMILDLLDEEVTRTLKQDESDASTRDGMDISLCKINRKKCQIEYSGAHRPLYYLTNTKLHEVKGNKFPIGGAQYKNRSKFTNTIINYKEGDAIYLFSDGFPDQFGGPKNKKFSPRKIRDLIRNNALLDVNDISRTMDAEFEKWRGNNKQTDDVLMIGIRF